MTSTVSLSTLASASFARAALAFLALAHSPLNGAAQERPERLRISSTRAIHDGSGISILTDPKFVRLVVAQDGRVYLLQPFTANVTRLGPGQSTVKELGRKGGGPGEYQLPAWMGVVADTLWVFDVGSRRITLIPSFGTGRPTTIPFVGGFVSGVTISTIAALSPDGSAIATSGGDARLAAAGTVQRLPLLRTSRDGAKIMDTVAMLDIHHAVRTVQVGSNRATQTTEEPFSDKSVWAVSPDGAYVAVVTQPDGPGQTRNLTLYRFTGEKVYVVPIPFPQIPMSTSDARSIIDQRYDAMIEALGGRRTGVPSRSEFGQGLFLPRQQVPVTDVVVGADGTVVLRGNDWLGDTVDYAWLGKRGTTSGYLSVPRRQHIRAINGNRFWSVTEGAVGQLRVVQQELVPPR